MIYAGAVHLSAQQSVRQAEVAAQAYTAERMLDAGVELAVSIVFSHPYPNLAAAGSGCVVAYDQLAVQLDFSSFRGGCNANDPSAPNVIRVGYPDTQPRTCRDVEFGDLEGLNPTRYVVRSVEC
jgi:hypothetical protein